jgi:hypothetical protein
VTLAVTVVCQDGVVVAADSRTTLANDRTLRAGGGAGWVNNTGVGG